MPASRVGKAVPELSVEITQDAARFLDVTLTRRLIALELGETQVSEFVDADGLRLPPTLFFRVALDRSLALVELWERGRLYGSRRVTLQGNQHLRARRVALIAAELGRRLRERSLGRALDAVDRHAARERRLEALIAQGAAFSTGFRTGPLLAFVGVAGWLLGPRAELVLRLPGHLRADMAGAWAFGSVARGDAHAPLNWWEVSLSPAYYGDIAANWEMGLGFRAAAAVAQLSRVPGDQSIQWTARAALEPALGWQVKRGVNVGFRPELGWVLRPMQWPFEASANDELELSGAWLGASLLVTLGASR